jgi:hypothetical protein
MLARRAYSTWNALKEAVRALSETQNIGRWAMMMSQLVRVLSIKA